jgi:nonribosomal peptide synthetase DhbF
VVSEGVSAIVEQRLLLTGATGHVGAHILRALLRDPGVHVTCIVRAQSVAAAEERLASVACAGTLDARELRRRVGVVLGDLAVADFDRTRAEFNVLTRAHDAILHAAAWTGAGIASPRDVSTNVTGTKAIVELAARTNAHLHYVSTIGVFRWMFGDVQEDALPPPPGAADRGAAYYDYHCTKARAEEIVRGGAGRTTIYRLGNVAKGAGSLPLLVRAVLDTGMLPDGEGLVHWFANTISAEMIGQMLARMAIARPPADGPFTLIEQPTFSVSELRPFFEWVGIRPKAVDLAKWMRVIERDTPWGQSVIGVFRSSLQARPARRFDTRRFHAMAERYGFRIASLADETSAALVAAGCSPDREHGPYA